MRWAGMQAFDFDAYGALSHAAALAPNPAAGSRQAAEMFQYVCKRTDSAARCAYA